MVGVSLAVAPAMGLAGQRSERVAEWLGAPAGDVVQQFAAHISATGDPDLFLDLSEWFDGFADRDEGWLWLRETLAVLDTLPKRGARPGAVPRPAAQLLRALGLKSADNALPAFGHGLAGTACTGVEAWRRYPPRLQRTLGEALVWSLDGSGERCLLSADGETLLVMAKNRHDLATPFIRFADGRWERLPVDASIERVWMTHLSDNGKVLIGNYQPDPTGEQHSYRYTAETGFETLLVNSQAFAASHGSADGNTAVGWVYGSAGRAFDELLPAVWRAGQGMVINRPGQAAWGVASRASADGSVVVGQWRQGPGGVQPFAWSEASGAVDVGGTFNSLTWRAVSPDGREGFFTANTRENTTDMTYHWRWGHEVKRCEDAGGAPIKNGYSCSRRADAVVGLAKSPDDATAFTAQIWTADNACKEVDLGSGWSRLAVERVGPQGQWLCIRASRNDDHGWYIWREGTPLQKQPGPIGIGSANFNVAAVSKPDQPEDLVLFCKCIWSEEGHTRLTPLSQEQLPPDPTSIR